MSDCHARASSDGQMRCPNCRLVWDRDEEKPQCAPRHKGDGKPPRTTKPLIDLREFVSGLPD